MSWPEAVLVADQVLLYAVIDRGEDQANLLERTLRWLNDGLRELLAETGTSLTDCMASDPQARPGCSSRSAISRAPRTALTVPEAAA